MDNQSTKQTAQVFADAFTTSLAEALTQAVGTPFISRCWTIRILAHVMGSPVHFRLTADGALHGECYIELYQPQVAELGSKILGQPAAAFREEHSEALVRGHLRGDRPAHRISLSSNMARSPSMWSELRIWPSAGCWLCPWPPPPRSSRRCLCCFISTESFSML